MSATNTQQQRQASRRSSSQVSDPAEGVTGLRRKYRSDLLTLRCTSTEAQRHDWNKCIENALRDLLPDEANTVFGLYWPFRCEFAIRPLMRELHKRGGLPALPRVIERNAPLVFFHWYPGVTMQDGAHGIPEPVNTEPMTPDVLVVPVVGFDANGYRLGYGGGYYDRTIKEMRRRPLLIGVGYELSRLDTIHPQTHDIPMDYIVTEAGVTDCR